MLTWQPVSNHEIEQTRRHRKVQRLEHQLAVLRTAQWRFLSGDDIAALERELSTLRGQGG